LPLWGDRKGYNGPKKLHNRYNEPKKVTTFYNGNEKSYNERVTTSVVEKPSVYGASEFDPPYMAPYLTSVYYGYYMAPYTEAQIVRV